MESCLECRNENWHSISLVVYFSDRGLLVAHINFLDDSLWLWHLVCHVFMFYSKWLHEQTWHGNWTLILLVQKIWKGCFDPICGSLLLLLFLSSLVEKDLKLCFCSVYNEISRLFMFSFFFIGIRLSIFVSTVESLLVILKFPWKLNSNTSTVFGSVMWAWHCGGNKNKTHA